jgi:type I restriction enzyme S subunit
MVDHAILGSPGEERSVAGLAQYLNGWPFRPEDFTNDGLPVIRIEQLVDPEAPVDRYSGNLPAKARLRDGDLVFSWSGSLQVRTWNRGDAYLNQHLFRVEPARGVDRAWLGFALEAAIRLFQAHMHGSAMTHITRSTMKAVRLPVPPIDSQTEIASTLARRWAALQQVEDLLTRQIDLLTERQQALVTSAVVGAASVSAVGS